MATPRRCPASVDAGTAELEALRLAVLSGAGMARGIDVGFDIGASIDETAAPPPAAPAV